MKKNKYKKMFSLEEKIKNYNLSHNITKLEIISETEKEPTIKEALGDKNVFCYVCDKEVNITNAFWSKSNIKSNKIMPKLRPHDKMIICKECYEEGK